MTQEAQEKFEARYKQVSDWFEGLSPSLVRDFRYIGEALHVRGGRAAFLTNPGSDLLRVNWIQVQVESTQLLQVLAEHLDREQTRLTRALEEATKARECLAQVSELSPQIVQELAENLGLLYDELRDFVDRAPRLTSSYRATVSRGGQHLTWGPEGLQLNGVPHMAADTIEILRLLPSLRDLVRTQAAQQLSDQQAHLEAERDRYSKWISG